MKNNILILGAGGMAREVYQIYEHLGRDDEIAGFLVNIKGKHEINKLPKELINIATSSINKGMIMINGIGLPVRKRWIASLEKAGFSFDNAIHPSVILGANIQLGKDVVICANTVLTRDIIIGNHVIINVNSSVSHDVVLNDFVTVSPGVHIGGRVNIGEGTFIGIGTNIIQDITIGKNVIVGAGSVVVHNIPSNTLAFGNPAKVIRKIGKKDFEAFL